MPRISEFFGTIISMYYNDHSPPHFHATYAEHRAEVGIESLEVIQGEVPRRVLTRRVLTRRVLRGRRS
jgi:hypothetical protein